MARTKRNTTRLLAALRDQRELLKSASRAFDEGSHAEAQNLAVRLRVLLHDGGRHSQSLLGQLELKERLPYLDTSLADPPAGVLRLDAGLCMMSAQIGPGGSGSSRYAAPLDKLSPDREHPPQPFVDWWGDPVVADDHDRPVSRAQFVLWLANQEGGAHVDPSIDETYAALSTSGVSAFTPPEGADPRFRDLVAPSVRQIAYEVDRTLDEHLVEDPDGSGALAIRDPICSLSIHKRVKAGRNEQCPCGSGRKRKKCFDLRAPRRRIGVADLRAELNEPPSA